MKTQSKPKAKILVRKTKAGGQKGAWRYTVKGANGEILVTSEGYTTKQNAERGSAALVLVILDYAFEKAQQAINWPR